MIVQAVASRDPQPMRRVSAVPRNRGQVAYRCAYECSRDVVWDMVKVTNRTIVESRLGVLPKRIIVQTALGTTGKDPLWKE